jgi:hypothetical protein
MSRRVLLVFLLAGACSSNDRVALPADAVPEADGVLAPDARPLAVDASLPDARPPDATPVQVIDAAVAPDAPPAVPDAPPVVPDAPPAVPDAATTPDASTGETDAAPLLPDAAVVAPRAAISSGPPDPTAACPTVSFAYTTEPQRGDAHFICALVTGPGPAAPADYAPCSINGETYTGLVDARQYTFSVIAVDPQGTQGAAASETFVVDGAGPVITITAPAAGDTGTAFAVQFTVTGGTGGTTCTVSGTGGGTVTNCMSGQTFSGLAEGPHTVTVSGADQCANPGSAEVAIQVVVPTTVTVATPGNDGVTCSVGSLFYDVAGAASVRCTLDQTSVACDLSGVYTFSGLAGGGHDFTVTGYDAFGQVTGMASAHFTVDVVGPPVVIQPPPSIAGEPGHVCPDTAISFDCSQDADPNDCPPASTLCAVDHGDFQPCDPHHAAFTGLAPGSHTITAMAADGCGNYGPPASVSFVVDPPPALDLVQPNTSPLARIAYTTSGTLVSCSVTDANHPGATDCKVGYGGLYMDDLDDSNDPYQATVTVVDPNCGVTTTKSVTWEVVNHCGEPKTSVVSIPTPRQLVEVPTQNKFADDYVVDGGITLGDTLYFFANSGHGAKLYSYDAAHGVVQRSNTNPRGPDKPNAGGFRAVDGVLYFTAYDAEGCIKIFRYAPGDPLVTKPLFDVNPDACVTIPDQVAVRPTDGDGLAGSIPKSGSDVPYAGYFDPIALAGKLYFVAYDGTGHEVWSWDPVQGGKPTALTAFGADGNWTNTYLLGSDGTTLTFVGPLGIYQYTPGTPFSGKPANADAPPVTSAIARGLRVGQTVWFYDGLELASWTLGDKAATPRSDTTQSAQGQFGKTGDEVADIVPGPEGTIAFSALDPDRDRKIYAFSGEVVTEPINVDFCQGQCSYQSIYIGELDGNFYFNARNQDHNLGFYVHAGAVTSRAFTINTDGDDETSIQVALNGWVYFLAYRGFTGEIFSDKFPDFIFQRGNGRTGYGDFELYSLSPEGQATHVFETNSADDHGDDTASGTKYPSHVTVVGDSVIFVARDPSTGPDDETYHLYEHTPGQGLVSQPINTDFRVPGTLIRLAVDGRLYFIGDVGTPGNEQDKLFEYTPGQGSLSAADAITDLVPGGSDQIRGMIDVGGTLVFYGLDADGNGKLYQYIHGDAKLTTADAMSNIVPGGDDALSWTIPSSSTEDTSLVDGNLLLTSTAPSGDISGFVFAPDADHVLAAGDAVKLAGGAGTNLRVYNGQYYLVPGGEGVIGGTVYPLSGAASFSGFKPVEYARRGWAIDDTQPDPPYLESNPDPKEYVKLCSLYGNFSAVVSGVDYTFVYIPGTDLCSYVAMSPDDQTAPYYDVPFPGIGVRQTQFGTAGADFPLKHDHGFLMFRGGVRNGVDDNLLVDKAFSYSCGLLTALTPDPIGNDFPSLGVQHRDATFFGANDCGGLMDYQDGGNGYYCQRLYRYTP